MEDKESSPIFSWENVLNSTHKWWGHISYFQDFAEQSGYKWFEWNQRIYTTKDCKDTGLTIKDIVR